jgi:hypothetical protein
LAIGRRNSRSAAATKLAGIGRWKKLSALPGSATGACEHSRFTEDLLGGVTRESLAGADLPVLMSH